MGNERGRNVGEVRERAAALAHIVVGSGGDEGEWPVPRRSFNLEVRADSAYQTNIRFLGTSWFSFLDPTKHSNKSWVRVGPITFHLVIETEHILTACLSLNMHLWHPSF